MSVSRKSTHPHNILGDKCKLHIHTPRRKKDTYISIDIDEPFLTCRYIKAAQRMDCFASEVHNMWNACGRLYYEARRVPGHKYSSITANVSQGAEWFR